MICMYIVHIYIYIYNVPNKPNLCNARTKSKTMLKKDIIIKGWGTFVEETFVEETLVEWNIGRTEHSSNRTFVERNIRLTEHSSNLA